MAVAASVGQAAPVRRVVDRIIALAGPEVITEHEVTVALRPYLPLIYRIDDPQKRAAALERRRFDVLEQIIDEHLILQEARRLELPVADEEIEAYIQKTMRANGWSEAQFVDNLRQLGYESLDAYREKTRREMLKSYAFQIRVGSRVNVTDDEVDALYRERYADGAQEEVRASHILIRVPEMVTVARLHELREKTQGLRAQLEAGADFAELAKAHSEDAATAEDGGDVGYFPRYLLDDTFTAVAFSLRPGETSDVVQTALGFHIIRLLDRRRVPIAPYAEEEIRGYIRQELRTVARERAYRAWMRELRESAFVDIRLPRPATDEEP